MERRQVVILISGGRNVFVKPEVSTLEATDLAAKYFGFKVSEEQEVRAMDGYDDRNYFMKGRLPDPASIDDTGSDGEFVFKVYNSCSTVDLEMFEIIDKMSLLFTKQCAGVRFPSARLSLDGKTWALADIPLKYPYDVQGGCLENIATRQLLGDVMKCEPCADANQIGHECSKDEARRDPTPAYSFRHVLRIVEYIPGTTVTPGECSNDLLIEVGRLAASMRSAVQEIKAVKSMENQELIWHLSNVHRLRAPYIEAVEGEKYKALLLAIVHDFEEKTLPLLDVLEKGCIHADISPQNLIVSRQLDSHACKIVGLIDFGCATFACYVFDLAIALAYFGALVPENFVNSTCAILSGYCSNFELPGSEFAVLFNLVMSRVAQSLAIGEYMYRVVEPGNEFLIANVENMKKTLDFVHDAGHDYVISRWRECVRIS